MTRNPFSPTFGVSPPLLVGRDDLIGEFASGLGDGPGSPSRATLYTGARGTGKTVILNAVQEVAKEQAWLVISETATPGFITRLATIHLPGILSSQRVERKMTRLTGVSLPFGAGGATWDTTNVHPTPLTFRNQLELVTDTLAEHGTGVLITLDELHYRQIDELREFGATLQHAFREEREVAFAGAGLPSAVSAVLNDNVLTFLQRADRYVLGPVDFADVERAIREPIEANGRTIAAAALDEAAHATGGYPFLIQLVGRYSWRQHPSEEEITLADVTMGVTEARKRMGSLIFEPALADLSDIDRTFLTVMAQDDGPSRMSDICVRLNVTANFGSQYRLRLIEAGLIEGVRHGEVDFVQPLLREYLREHAIVSALRSGNPKILGEQTLTFKPPKGGGLRR